MEKTKKYYKIAIAVASFLTAIAIYLTFWAAPIDFQQGENAKILYVHVPVAWMSILIYIFTAINSFAFLLTKHPIALRMAATAIEIGTIATIATLVTGALWARPMWGTYWVWDARLTAVFIPLLIYITAIAIQKINTKIAAILICIGSIDIPIIKFSVNWWNTLHQPTSINTKQNAIHIAMITPIITNTAILIITTILIIAIEIRITNIKAIEKDIKKQLQTQEI